MAKRTARRVHRTANESDRRRHAELVREIETEADEIVAEGRKLRDAHEAATARLQQVLALLKEERVRQGVSLAEVRDATGIERSSLSRLENAAEANPTLVTLIRYADALGKDILVTLADQSSATDAAKKRGRTPAGQSR